MNLPIRNPNKDHMSVFTGSVDVIVPGKFETVLLARNGVVYRSVPKLSSLSDAPLAEVVERYRAHKGVYFIFRPEW